MNQCGCGEQATTICYGVKENTLERICVECNQSRLKKLNDKRVDIEVEDRLINLRIPLGTWGLNGSWQANPYVEMSAEDQRRSNIENGFCQS